MRGGGQRGRRECVRARLRWRWWRDPFEELHCRVSGQKGIRGVGGMKAHRWDLGWRVYSSCPSSMPLSLSTATVVSALKTCTDLFAE
jgi:hypothetical protein